MKRCLLALGLALLSVAPSPARADLAFKAQVDLNRDGVLETVTLKPFTQEGIRLDQLVVLDRKGRVLWAGPRHSAVPQGPSEPMVFGGEFDLGEVDLVGDVDGDGKVEVLGTYQQSDVRPPRFRLLRWTGDRFVHVRSGCLVPANQRPGTFVWKEHDYEASSWVQHFQAVQPGGTVQVKVQDLSGQAGEQVLTVRATAEGFQVVR